ncbi:TonB-dependent receptor domain-containing protein [Gemmatimonas sp.]|jgi:TonB-linked SusC/RagA family outer membrane protein|uniref:TonB-dependent receptor domain-containing protein n=1 Tax=Gemmatimonas sp. TaxID=1962908 RepID=UPI0037C10CAA
MRRPALWRATAKRLLPATISLVVSASTLQAQATGTINGRVVDAENGQPISAAQITISGTQLGRSTGDDGRFSLPSLTAGSKTLIVRRIGYQQQSRTVTLGANATITVDFSLAKSSVSLAGVVVTATGEERKKEVGNAVTTVSSADFERGGVGNTQQILQGRSTGVTVLANGGSPGAGGTIRLRGVNSITQGNRPLIYVDGIRIFNGNSPTGVSSRQSVSPLNDIPASDIERIEVVKGPAATTLYGTEASGGVIQIFTKRGRDGAASWTLDASGGINTMGDFGPSTDPTRMFVRECRGPNMVDANGVAFEDATCPKSGSWLKNGYIGRYSLGVRGASGGINYAISGNLENEEGVLRVGTNKTGGMRANLGFAPTKTVTLALNSSWQRRNTAMISDGNSADAFLLNVSRGPGSNFRGGGCSTPTIVCVVNDTMFSKANTIGGDHFIVGGTATWTPFENLTNRLAIGIDYNNTDQRTINPFGYPRTPTGQYFQTLWNRQLITVDYATSWKQTFSKNFTGTTSFGGQLFDSRLNSTELQGDNFAGPGTPTLLSASLRQITDVNQQRVINAGLFAQQMIGWRDKLFITAGARIDGNSAFGQSFGLQTYPKVSGSWVLSEESFWPTNLVETFKLRGAVGEAGKAPGAFDATRTWNPVAAEGGQPAFTPGQLGNPNLGPERTRETEYGFDAGFLNGRLGLVFTAFSARTNDAIINVAYPPSQGFTSNQPENVGVIKNSGFEAQLTGNIDLTSWAKLETRLQFTKVQGEAVDLGGRVITLDALSRSYVAEGLPLPAYMGRRVKNANAFEAPILEENQFLGQTFADKIINPSVTLTLFRNLTIEAIGEFQRGGHLLNANGFQNAGLGIWQPCFAAQKALRAAAAGDASALASVTAFDRMRCSITASERDYSYWVESADFFKLRNLSLSYEVPKRYLPRTRSMTVTFAGRNLFRSTNYTGTDPEVADQRTSTFSRRDYYNFPPYRTFLFSVRTNF